MVTSAPISRVEELWSVLDNLSNRLENIPFVERDSVQEDLQKIRAYLNIPASDQAQVNVPGHDRRRTKAMTGLFFDHMREPAIIYELVRDETGATVDMIHREMNNACQQALGLESSQVVGKTVRAVFGDDLFLQLVSKIDNTLATTGAVYFEERLGDGDYLASMFRVNENTVAKIAIDITERKQAENEIALVNDALARSEAKYRALEERYSKAFHSSPAAMAISRISDGKFLEINDNHQKVTGYTRKETIGHTSKELGLFLDPDEREKLVALLREQGGIRDYEMKTRKRSGEVLTILLSAEPFDLDGEACILETINDINDRKQAEVLSQAENEINQYIHSTLDYEEIMHRTVTAGAKALACDTAALSQYKDGRWVVSKVYGLPAETLGMVMDDQQELHALLAIQTRKPVAVTDAFNDERFNREHLRAWGIRSVLVVPVIIRDEVLGVMFFNYQHAVFEFKEAHIQFGIKVATSLSLALENAKLYHSLREEINVRTQIEEKLREREASESARAAELEMLMDAAPAIIWVSRDPECREIFSNRRGYELLHMEPGENISKSSAEAIPANRHYQFMRDGKPIPSTELPMQVAAATAKPARDVMVDLVFDDGSAHKLIGNVNPLFGQDGKPAGAIAAFIDITHQLELEKQQMEFRTQMEVHHRLMDQREKDRQSIARDIHDGPVQTLSSTLFNIQFAKEVAADPQFRVEMEQIALNVRNAVQELRQVIFELRPPSVIRFGLARAIHYHAEDLREKYPELKLTLRLSEDQNQLSELTCLTLYRIYQEAVTNVTRHAEATRVWVRFRLLKDSLTLEIRDNGKGFPETDNLGRLTEHGHFGLAGIKERVEVVGGKLKITSEPGKGTSILVKAPISPRI